MSVMYEDLAILAEGIVQSVIQSEYRVKPILFYDAYRALDELCEAVYEVAVYFDSSFDFKEESTRIRQREKWIRCMNEYLEACFQKSRTYFLRFGAIYCVYENSRHAFSPISDFCTMNSYFSMFRDDYTSDRVKDSDALILHRNVLIMPDKDKPIDTSNKLCLESFEERIDEFSVRQRLKKEGAASLDRLEKVCKVMEEYLAQHITVSELFPRRVIL